jgi:hypothetical protein
MGARFDSKKLDANELSQRVSFVSGQTRFDANDALVLRVLISCYLLSRTVATDACRRTVANPFTFQRNLVNVLSACVSFFCEFPGAWSTQAEKRKIAGIASKIDKFLFSNGS